MYALKIKKINLQLDSNNEDDGFIFIDNSFKSEEQFSLLMISEAIIKL